MKNEYTYSFEHSLQIEERIYLFVREIHYSDPSRRAILAKKMHLLDIFFCQNIWSCQYFALTLQSKSRLEKCVEADKSRLEKCGKVYKSRLKKCVEARKSGLEKCSKTMNLHHFGADLAKFCIILVQIL